MVAFKGIGCMYRTSPLRLPIALKLLLFSHRVEITDKSVAHFSQSVEPTNVTLNAYDKTTGVKKPSGRHTMSSTEENVLTLVEHIMDGDVFNTIPGRRHASFPNMPHNLLDQLDQSKLKKIG